MDSKQLFEFFVIDYEQTQGKKPCIWEDELQTDSAKIAFALYKAAFERAQCTVIVKDAKTSVLN